jgi:hypothetical protein
MKGKTVMKNIEVTAYIQARIKHENSKRPDDQPISRDADNTVLVNILLDASQLFDVHLGDNQDVLEAELGQYGWSIIRDAEQGIYGYMPDLVALNLYKLRAECPVDVKRLEELADNQEDMIVTKVCDCDCEPLVQSNMSKKELVALIETIPDSHVMTTTLALYRDYTGIYSPIPNK